jgi:hypothetical protein
MLDDRGESSASPTAAGIQVHLQVSFPELSVTALLRNEPSGLNLNGLNVPSVKNHSLSDARQFTGPGLTAALRAGALAGPATPGWT